MPAVADHSYFEELIAAAIDGELSPAEQTELDAHLAVCPRCRAFREAMEAVSGVTAKHLPPPPADFTDRVMDAVRAQAAPPVKKKRKPGILPFPARAAALAAVAALVLGVGTWAARSLKMGSAASTAAYNGAGGVQMRSMDTAATQDAPVGETEESADAAEAPAEGASAETASAPDPDNGAVPAVLFRLYAGEDVSAAPLLESGDGEFLSLLLTADEPAQVPDRAADYTLVYTGEDGETGSARLWGSDGAMIVDAGAGAGYTVSAARFREVLEAEN